MNEKFQPGDEMFDDVEGHLARSGRALPAEGDDVEGHAMRGKVTSDGDDVEGHAIKARGVVADEQDEDDVEGHATRGRA